jgi:gamma-glutamylcyclotransferase (GGCT)/AIG2-like uncharacterized protein YtfP
MSEFLFAYGTLRPGLAPLSMAALVEQMVPIGAGSVCGRLYDLGEFPGAVLDAESGRRIYGTIFRLPNEADFLKALDDYEGFEPDCPEASLFSRVLCQANLAAGAAVSCWIYVYRRQVEGLTCISSWPAS